jgi:hypothetical protein
MQPAEAIYFWVESRFSVGKDTRFARLAADAGRPDSNTSEALHSSRHFSPSGGRSKSALPSRLPAVTLQITVLPKPKLGS